MNQAGLDLLKHYEGFSATAYLDSVGVPTIGFGFTENVHLGDKITMQDALDRLARELGPRETRIRFLCSKTATDNQHAAFTSFAYNVGMDAFQHSTLLKMHNAGDPNAADQFLRWDKAAGRVLPGLVKRRAAERTLYLTPDGN